MEVRIDPSPPTAPDAAQLISEYMTDIVARWHGRPAEPHEVTQAMQDEPASDVREPQGHFAVAYVDGAPVGIGGVRLVDRRIAELTKLFTRSTARGQGVASQMLDYLESIAPTTGHTTVRLDTRSDLVEACRLYESRGYQRIAPFTDSIYSDRWYEKELVV